MAATYKVYVDWNADGSFAGAREDVTARVLDGRHAGDHLSTAATASASCRPPPSARAASPSTTSPATTRPENAASPLAGQVLPARSVLITGQAPGGAVVNMFRGQLEDFKVQPAFDERYIQVECVDPLGELRGVKVSTELWQGLRPGEAIGLILDAVGCDVDAAGPRRGRHGTCRSGGCQRRRLRRRDVPARQRRGAVAAHRRRGRPVRLPRPASPA
jgi:hypothetical protein